MEREFCVVLHDIRSIHNVGSIFRTADAAGVLKVYLCGITPTPTDRFKEVRVDFAKVSLGAERTVAWEYMESTAAAIEVLRTNGYAIFAVEQSEQSTPYFEVKNEDRRNKFCLVMGNEVEGLPSSISALADRILEIPMFGKKESLNVAVAFGIVAFGLRLPHGTI